MICTWEVEGFVASNEQVTVQKTNSYDDGSYYYSVTEYAAVYQYEVAGVTYQSQSKFSSGSPHFKENTRVAIHYNPQNPQECFVPADPYNKGTGFVIFACLLLGMGVASLVKVSYQHIIPDSSFRKTFFDLLVYTKSFVSLPLSKAYKNS